MRETDSRKPILAALDRLGADVIRNVSGILPLTGGRRVHGTKARPGERVPDFTVYYGRIVLWMELKAPGGTGQHPIREAEQRAFMDRMAREHGHRGVMAETWDQVADALGIL